MGYGTIYPSLSPKHSCLEVLCSIKLGPQNTNDQKCQKVKGEFGRGNVFSNRDGSFNKTKGSLLGSYKVW